QGDGEEPGRALRHGAGTGRRPAPLAGGQADPGSAAFVAPGGDEVGAAAQAGGVGDGGGAAPRCGARWQYRAVVGPEAGGGSRGGAGVPSRGDPVVARGEMVGGPPCGSAGGKGSRRLWSRTGTPAAGR